MKQKKLVKIKIIYENEKLSKKPQVIIGEVKGPVKKTTKKIKIKRRVTHETVTQTFNLTNKKKIKGIFII